MPSLDFCRILPSVLGHVVPEAWQHCIRRFATPASFLLTSNDPAGFNIIDVLAWGALGHALGYFILVRPTVFSHDITAPQVLTRSPFRCDRCSPVALLRLPCIWRTLLVCSFLDLSASGSVGACRDECVAVVAVTEASVCLQATNSLQVNHVPTF